MIKDVIKNISDNIFCKIDWLKFPFIRDRSEIKKKDKVILIVLDSVRSDAVNSKNTPNIYKLAKEGLYFTNCIAQAPFTTVSIASIFTGLNPYNHGIRHLVGEKIRKEIKTLTEILNRKSLAIVSCFHLAHLSLQKGFTDFIYPLKLILDKHGRGNYPNAKKIVNLAKKYWHDYSFFFLHFFDAHVHTAFEYEDMYYKEIQYIDKHLARLFENLDRDDLVIITADHGEKWSGEHNFPYMNYKRQRVSKGSGHGPELYNEILRVPLIFWGKDITAQKLDYLARSIDILPSVCSILEIDSPENIDGISWFRQRDRVSYSETFTKETLSPEKKFPPFVCLQNEQWKLICQVIENGLEPYEVFNLEKDYKEERSIDFEKAPEIVKNFFQELRQKQEKILKSTKAKDIIYSQAVKENLKSLGYL